ISRNDSKKKALLISIPPDLHFISTDSKEEFISKSGLKSNGKKFWKEYKNNKYNLGSLDNCKLHTILTDYKYRIFKKEEKEEKEVNEYLLEFCDILSETGQCLILKIKNNEITFCENDKEYSILCSKGHYCFNRWVKDLPFSFI